MTEVLDSAVMDIWADVRSVDITFQPSYYYIMECWTQIMMAGDRRCTAGAGCVQRC